MNRAQHLCGQRPKAKGAIFIEELSDVPPGSTLVFSAHGVSRACSKRPSNAVSAF